MGAATHARERRVARSGRAATAIRLSSRVVFQIVIGIVLVATLVLLVIQPAIERGGAGELLLVAGIFGAILLLERWLRTR